MKRKLTDDESSKLKKRNAEESKVDEPKAINSFEYDCKKFRDISLKPWSRYAICKTMENGGHIFNCDDDIEVCVGVNNKKKVLTYAKIVFFVINKEEKKASVFVKWYFNQKELTDKCRRKFKNFAKELDAKNRSKIIFQSEMFQIIPVESINRKVSIGHINDFSVTTEMSKFEKVFTHHYSYKNCYLTKFDPNKNVSILEEPFYYFKKMVIT